MPSSREKGFLAYNGPWNETHTSMASFGENFGCPVRRSSETSLNHWHQQYLNDKMQDIKVEAELLRTSDQ